MHPYQIFLKFKNIDIFKSEFIEKKLEELLQAEYSIKNGTLDDEIAVETLILNFFTD